MTGTAFERAVIGALALLANALEPHHNLFTDQEIGAAQRAVGPFLGETPSENVETIDAAIGLTPSPHRHDWVQYTLANGAIFASCSFCSTGIQLR